jgi:hypothetical protein
VFAYNWIEVHNIPKPKDGARKLEHGRFKMGYHEPTRLELSSMGSFRPAQAPFLPPVFSAKFDNFLLLVVFVCVMVVDWRRPPHDLGPSPSWQVTSRHHLGR